MGAMHKPLLTAEQYLEIERAAVDRSDFLDGEMIAMPGGSKAHSRICVNLTIAASMRLKAGPNEVYSNDMRVRTIPTRHFTYPDLTITASAGEFEGDKSDILTNPAVIFEVLSPSTIEYDRTRKCELTSPRMPSVPKNFLLILNVSLVFLNCGHGCLAAANVQTR